MQDRQKPNQDESYKAYQDAIKEGKERAIKKYSPNTTNIENDKMSLVKRLNAVLSELEKVRSEKSILTARLNDQLKAADELKDRIKKSEELTGVISKNLQEDLKYERSLNGKLREEIRSAEDQRAQASRQQSTITESIADSQSSSNFLGQQIEEKDKEIRCLENEKNKLSDLLSNLNSKRSIIAEELSSEELEKQKLLSQLEQLDKSKDALLDSLNHEEENYSNSMGQLTESDTTSKEHCNSSVKELSAKVLASLLGKLCSNTLTNSYQSVKSFCFADKCSEFKFKRLIDIMAGHYKWKKNQAFKLWTGVCIHWKVQWRLKEKTLEKLQTTKEQLQLANETTTKADYEAKLLSDSNDAAKSINWFLNDKISDALYNALSTLKRAKRFKESVKTSLIKLSHLKYHSSTRIAFNNLKCHSGIILDAQKVHALTQVLTDSKYLQQSFFLFKDGIRKLRFEKKLSKLYAIKTWQHQKYKEQVKSHATMLCIKLENMRNQEMLQFYFNAIKAHGKESNYNKVNEELSNTKPARIEAQKQLENSKKDLHTKGLMKCCRIISSLLADKVHSYIYHWMYLSKRYGLGKDKVGIIVGKKQVRLRWLALRGWMDGVHNKKAKTISSSISNTDNIQEEISLEQVKQQKVLTDMKNGIQNVKLKKTKANLVNMKNMVLRRKLYQWARNALARANHRFACRKLADIERRHMAGKALHKYKKVMADIGIQENFNNRVTEFNKKVARSHLKSIFNSLKNFGNRFKTAKATLKHALGSVKRSYLRIYIRRWSHHFNSIDTHQFTESNADKKEELTVLVNKESELQNEAAIANSAKVQYIKEDKLRNMRFISNAADRKNYCKLYFAFSKWIKRSRCIGKTVNSISKFVANAQRKSQVAYFSKWLSLSKKMVVADEEKALKDTTNKKRILKEDLLNKNKGNDSAIEDSQAQFEQQANTAKEAQAVYDQTTNLILKRASMNCYKSLKQACFEAFKDIVTQQKQLMEKVLLKAENMAKSHVLITLKNKHLENKRAQRKQTTLKKLLSKVVSQHLRTGFGEWMSFVKYHAAENQLEEIDNVKQVIANTEENSLAKKTKHLNDIKENIIDHKKLSTLRFIMGNLCDNKRLQNKLETASNKIASRLKRNQLKRFFFNCSYPLRLGKASRVQSNKHSKLLTSAAFRMWKRNFHCNRTLPTLAFKFCEAQCKQNVKISLQMIKEATKYNKSINDIKETETASSLFKALSHIIHMNQLSMLHAFKSKTDQSISVKAKIRQIIAHIYGEQMNRSFNIWRRHDKIICTEEFYEEEGPNAVKLKGLQSNFEKVNEYMRAEGYSETEIENRLQNEYENNNGAIKACISRWINFKSTNQDVSDTMSRWRRYAHARKIIYISLLTLNSLANRGQNAQNGLLVLFKRWRAKVELPKEILMKKPKDALLRMHVMNSKGIQEQGSQLAKATQQEEENLHSKINLTEKNALCKGDTIRFIIHLHENGLKSAFKKWQIKSNKLIVAQQQKMVEELHNQIAKLNSQIKYFDEHNKKLAGENEDLRVSALESVEFLKNAQQITKDRQILSMDLADKTVSINSLISENKAMKEKFAIAKAEASKLLSSQ